MPNGRSTVGMPTSTSLNKPAIVPDGRRLGAARLEKRNLTRFLKERLKGTRLSQVDSLHEVNSNSEKWWKSEDLALAGDAVFG